MEEVVLVLVLARIIVIILIHHAARIRVSDRITSTRHKAALNSSHDGCTARRMQAFKRLCKLNKRCKVHLEVVTDP